MNNKKAQKSDVIYLDNAATSWPKPDCVAEAMVNFINNTGASPGRSGHRLSVEAGRIVYYARETMHDLFNGPDPLNVVFTHNVTESLNLCLNGLLRAGDHVITGSMEHNSMMRPLRELERNGVDLTIVNCSPEGCIDPDDVVAAIRPNTSMIALNHASNVTGGVLPVSEIGRMARLYDILFLVDTAQTAGAWPIDMQADNIDLLCFTGHKSLYGPTGTGGVIIGDRVNINMFKPLKRGGTGSRSEFEDQPDFLPDMAESGTLNTVGLAGLEAGIRWIMEKGIENIRQHELTLLKKMIEGLSGIKGISVYGPLDMESHISVVSFNIDHMDSSEVGLILADDYNIMCRVGLHCSPSSHRTIGTFPGGTVRFATGAFNSSRDVDIALDAVADIAHRVV